MSSQQNNFDIAALVLAHLQQHGQQAQGNDASLPPIPVHQHQPALAATDQGADSLSALLARHLQQTSWAAGLGGATSTTTAASANQSIMHSSSGPDRSALNQEVFESIKLMASVNNPGE